MLQVCTVPTPSLRKTADSKPEPKYFYFRTRHPSSHVPCPTACQGLIDNLGKICSSSAYELPVILPAALVRELASSATVSLLSHPDVAECVGVGESDDGEDGEEGGGGRGNHDFAHIVAEVYCSFLSVSESSGVGAEDSQHTKMGGANEESDATRTQGRESKPSPSSPSPSPSPPSFVQARTDERLHFLRLIIELIHVTAEELMCGIGMSGWHYNDAVSRMTNDLWEIACCRLAPSAVDDVEEGEIEPRCEFGTVRIQPPGAVSCSNILEVLVPKATTSSIPIAYR